MKTRVLILFAPIAFILLNSCQEDTNDVVVRTFIEAYNAKDSVRVMGMLHEDFTELFEKDTSILNKNTYANHYSWGKEMDDRVEFDIIGTNSDTVKVKSKYYCQRDKLLKLGPYVSERAYVVRDGQIVQIIEHHDDQFYEPRNETYQAFSNWLQLNKNGSFSDFPFNHDGAVKLKAVLKEYADEQDE